MEMNLRFHESEIGYWANRYTERQRGKDRIKEQELIDLKPEVLRRVCLTKDELYELARWKSTRRAKLTLENTEAFIKEITEKAFAATDDWTKMLTLTQLRGIGEPTGSAILHLLDKGQYPLLDTCPLVCRDGVDSKNLVPVLAGLCSVLPQYRKSERRFDATSRSCTVEVFVRLW